MSETPMTDPKAHVHGPGCTEFATSRRRFLQGASALVGGAALSTMGGGVFRQVAFGAGTADNVLVVLSLRGGADGLSLVVPHGESAYYAARPKIGIPRGALIARDDTFGLHPAFGPLAPMWDAGRMAAVHAVGLPVPNRSHFAAMEEMEDADLGSSQRRGWLNRMIGLDSSSHPLEAVQMGSGTVPTSLYGTSPVVATRGLRDLKMTGESREARVRRTRSLHRTWDHANGSLGRAARAAMTTSARIGSLATTETRPQNGARYPTGDLGNALADTARLLRADMGVETVTIDYGNWDMHIQVGNVTAGAMTPMVDEFAKALHAFYTDLGDGLGARVTVVTISEFGRRVAENGNQGLDHGYGNVMFLFGGGVVGGRFYCRAWPGLSSGNLVQGDLSVTTDYRSVLTEVLRARFPHVDTSKVFPGFIPQDALGVVR